MCVRRTEHLNIVLHVCRLSNAWCGGIVHSFARSTASFVHAHRHTYGDFTCVYATLLPSIQLHLQRNNNFSPDSLAYTTSAIIAHKTTRSKNFRHSKSEQEKENFPQSIWCRPLELKTQLCFSFNCRIF